MERINLRVTRGDDIIYQLAIVDQNDLAIDITGYTVFFTVKEKPTDTDANAVITKDITSHYNAEGGITQISLTPTDTDRIGAYYYDIQIKNGDGNITTPITGTISFKRDITIRTS